MAISPAARAQARDLLDFIDASPSPWHAVATATQRLTAAGFSELDEKERWSLAPGGRHFVIRGGSSLIAFISGSDSPAHSGFRLVGAHTDSPGLRLKPQAPHGSDGLLRLGVEVYGGPILATFTDRDLSLAGRVNVRDAEGVRCCLLSIDRPLLRLPNVAIHMNREVNEQGLKLNKQSELPLILSGLEAGADAGMRFRNLLGEALQVAPEAVVNWELGVWDTQKGNFWGAEEEFISDSQLDNLASCHAGLVALAATGSSRATAVCALFDHEEVGSESAAGASGSFLSDVLARVSAGLGDDGEGQRCALARSFFVSADMAHAYHPNFPGAYEPCHRVAINGGPVIKTNANQRYSTNAETAARFMALAERAGVAVQNYAHRTDLGCGSTIGPIVAARLGVPSVDVGNPMWSMHSLRETAGVADHEAMIRVLAAVFAD